MGVCVRGLLHPVLSSSIVSGVPRGETRCERESSGPTLTDVLSTLTRALLSTREREYRVTISLFATFVFRAHIGQRGEREKFLPGKKRRKEKEGEEAGETRRVVD